MSPKNRMKGAVSALLLLCAPCWAISAPSDDQAGERSQAIERYLRQCNRVHVCNGSFLVSQHGKIVYSGVVGQTSSDASRQLSTNSVFDIGSISKQFTAAAVVRLEEEGRLDIDQPVVSYLPGFPYPQVTVRHLLVQTSGVPDVMSHYTSLLKSGPVTNPVELADVVQVLQAEKLPLVSAPGGRWAYSNTGYVLLGKIIEATSGKSYADFLKDEFFIPLGMDRTRVRTPAGEDALGERAMGFAAFADGTTKPYDQIPQLYLYGAGGIYSTAEDLLHWAQALQRGRVMSAKHWEEATRPTTLLDGSQSLYGFGLSLKPSPLGHERITHGGHWRGFKTELTLLPAMDTVIVLLTNNGEDDSVEDARDAVETILAGKQAPIVPEPFQWQVADHVATDNLSALKRWLMSVRSRAQDVDLAEKEVNNIGYALLERKQFSKAVAVLEFNHLAHSGSTNAMDSLADAYLANGETDKAKEQLQAILAIAPDSTDARKRLSDLSK